MANPVPGAAARPWLATNRSVRGLEETQYHTIVRWEGLAETVHAYAKRGDPLYVEGRLQYRSFPNEQGRERMATEIVPSDVQFLGRPQGRSPAEVRASEAGPATAGRRDISPGEIPF